MPAYDENDIWRWVVGTEENVPWSVNKPRIRSKDLDEDLKVNHKGEGQRTGDPGGRCRSHVGTSRQTRQK